jgi:serine beta-lactamase-like protein LACTB
VSKLFTDIAVMQLVEQGKLDLDAPVTAYLPDFKPRNPFNKPISLRQLMAHRSGLVREPPVGNYFDPTNPSLEATVRSLNETELVYEPGTKTKYSNAGIAVVGYVLEKTEQAPFVRFVRQRVLEPLGMKRSSFEPVAELARDLARAQMWTYFGRTFEAPTFELGIAPAGSMYSTVTDLAKFMSALFAIDKSRILKADTLRQMWQPQFAAQDAKTGFGLGFMIEEFEGRRRLGHNGAVYGFATDLSALPDDKLGVAVVASKDCANGVATRVASVALSHLLAVRQGKPLPKIEGTKPISGELAESLTGTYRAKDRRLDVVASAGKLFLFPERAGMRFEVRAQGERPIVDDLFLLGVAFQRQGEGLKLGSSVYERVADTLPAPPPVQWRGLIGEYGWDHNTLYILEKHGKLFALIEWFFLYPLQEVSENVYRFPDFGLYHDERLIFTRDREGRATQVEAANVVFARRKLDGEGTTFRIQPVRSVEELRRAAVAAQPPAERGEFGRPDLVEVTSLDTTIKTDLRYATTNNFLSAAVYTPAAKAYLQRPAAEALVRINQSLAKQGYGLLIHDGYRPWAVTKIFWDATPEKFHMFVADPSQGSRHNRGCAVDLTLYDRATGKPIEMVGGYDEFSDRSFPDYVGGTSRQRWHRDLLRREMEKEGFTVFQNEWWHFDYRDWRKYPILNLSFEQLRDRKE